MAHGWHWLSMHARSVLCALEMCLRARCCMCNRPHDGHRLGEHAACHQHPRRGVRHDAPVRAHLPRLRAVLQRRRQGGAQDGSCAARPPPPASIPAASWVQSHGICCTVFLDMFEQKVFKAGKMFKQAPHFCVSPIQAWYMFGAVGANSSMHVPRCAPRHLWRWATRRPTATSAPRAARPRRRTRTCSPTWSWACTRPVRCGSPPSAAPSRVRGDPAARRAAAGRARGGPVLPRHFAAGRRHRDVQRAGALALLCHAVAAVAMLSLLRQRRCRSSMVSCCWVC